MWYVVIRRKFLGMVIYDAVHSFEYKNDAWIKFYGESMRIGVIGRSRFSPIWTEIMIILCEDGKREIRKKWTNR